MKLNTKRTLLVGFAFFLICMFWQAYDTIIPKILTDRFGLSQAWSGIVMALDNILALFMLPLFGSLSDKTHTKMGKRKPFILAGTLVAVTAFLLLTVADAAQLKQIQSVSTIDDPEAMSVIYDAVGDKTLTTPEGDSFVLADRYQKEEFCSICSSVFETKIAGGTVTYRLSKLSHLNNDPLSSFVLPTSVTVETKYKTHFVSYDGETFFVRDRETLLDEALFGDTVTVDGEDVSLSALYAEANGNTVTNSVYTNFVVPARQAYIQTITRQNPAPFIWFMAILLIVLVSMSTFRSPAVALMPDVTVKPLRSKANAVINLMGTFGGMIVLVLGMGFAFNNSAIANTFRPYFTFFAVVAGGMLLALLIFMLTVREPQWAAEAERDSLPEEKEPEQPEEAKGNRRLSKAELRSLLFILASVLLWFFGYNAVTSKYSVYATNVLDLDYSTTLLIANAAAVVSYLPIGVISSRFGRKKTILAGIIMLTAAFSVACFMRVGSGALVMNAMFALAGIGWATINVNSFPMVVELSKGGDIGRYTGYYYAASMAAQALTPFVSGLLMDRFGMTVLFPYAAAFAALAFVTMQFVRHGDAKPDAGQTAWEAAGGDAE